MQTVALFLGLVACVSGVPFPDDEYLLFEPLVAAEPPPNPPIPGLCDQLGLKTFVYLLGRVNLTAMLEGHPKEFTVFAPTDAAFEMLSQWEVDALMRNKTKLMEVLKFHIVEGDRTYLTNGFRNDNLLPSLQGMVRTNVYSMMTPDNKETKIFLASGSVISKPDQIASNGVVHVIDHVMTPPTKTVEGALESYHEFRIFKDLVEAAGLAADLSNYDTPHTVFVPSDKAFEEIPEEEQKNIMKDKDLLFKVVANHILWGTYYEIALYPGRKLLSYADRNLTISRMGDKLMIDDAEITVTNYTAKNGVIHEINKVLLPKMSSDEVPPAAPGNLIEEAKKLGLNMLVEAVSAAGLSEQVMDNTLTVFAPTDEAIKRLPTHVRENLTKDTMALQELLMYHAVPDMQVMSKDLQNEQLVASADDMMDNIRINIYAQPAMKKVTADGARVVSPDHMASNGVIHVIDRVMYPIPTMNIEQYLMHDNMYFSTLLDAIKAANINQLFTGPGPITLFAPDNAAFKKLPPGALDALLKDKTKLIEVLSYHVVQHTIFEEGLTKTIKTMNGKNLMVSMKEGKIMVDNATIDYPDRKVTNGVVHVIDQVLMPPPKELQELPAAPGNIIEEATKLKLNTLVSLVKAAGLTDMANYNQLTVIAPNDEAFRELPKTVLDFLSKNKTALQEVLMYHAIPDATVMSKDITNEELHASADDMSDNIRFNVYKPDKGMPIVTADGARVVQADHVASNGIIHVVDKVMFPVPTTNIVDFLKARGEFFGTLLTAAKDAGLEDDLMGPGPFTLFAPDDAAFKKLPPGALDALLKDKAKLQDVLKYHVLGETLYTHGMMDKNYMTEEGGNIRVMRHEVRPNMASISLNGNVTLKYADLSATNGVVHVVDQVLMPPSTV